MTNTKETARKLFVQVAWGRGRVIHSKIQESPLFLQEASSLARACGVTAGRTVMARSVIARDEREANASTAKWSRVVVEEG